MNLLSEVNSRIESLHRTKRGYEVPEKFSDDWLMFNASSGNILCRKMLEEEYTMLKTLHWIYYMQVKNLKELEEIKKK